MDLLHMAAANEIEETGHVKKLTVPGSPFTTWKVYKIPLEYLYYNDKNGRINTMYKKFQSENGQLQPKPGNSEYNKIFEEFIYNSNSRAMDDTLQSIKEKQQQEPGVVLADGRVIDGNRRFTALRMYQKQDNIPKAFEAVILNLDVNSENDEKKIKELELDLQLGREERVNYDPIDRIFDVYNTIEVEKLMTIEEYKKASGAGNTKGINRDLRLADLILRFIKIVSPGDNPEDKFYLARDLKLDGPIEEIESTISKLKDKNKESITDAVLAYLAVIKSSDGNSDSTRIMRDVKTNILRNDDTRQYFLEAMDEKVDVIFDIFEEKPIKDSNDLKNVINSSDDLKKDANRIQQTVSRLINKSSKDSVRRESLLELQDLRDELKELKADDLKELTKEEFFEVKGILQEIQDILYKLRREINK